MDLSQSQKHNIEKIAKKYQLKLVLLFGSQVEEKTHSESDIDIAYLSHGLLDFEREYHLNYEFTNLFQKDRVDTINITKAPPLLSYAIFQHPQILYEENELIFPSYQVYAFKKYIEARPLAEEKFKRLKERVSRQST